MKVLQNCSLKKIISKHGHTEKLPPQKMYSKTDVKTNLIKEILTDEHK